MKIAFYLSVAITAAMITFASYVTNDLTIAAAILSSFLSLVLYICAYAIFIKPEEDEKILDNMKSILVILSLMTFTSCNNYVSLETKCVGVDRKETIKDPTKTQIMRLYNLADSLTTQQGCDCTIIRNGDTLYVSQNNSVGLN